MRKPSKVVEASINEEPSGTILIGPQIALDALGTPIAVNIVAGFRGAVNGIEDGRR